MSDTLLSLMLFCHAVEVTQTGGEYTVVVRYNVGDIHFSTIAKSERLAQALAGAWKLAKENVELERKKAENKE